MKNIVKIQTILILAFFLSIPYSLFTQDESKEKKVRVKTVKEVDGKKIVKDTTFTVKDEDDVKKVVKEYTMIAEGDTEADIKVDVMVDTDMDTDMEWESEDGKKIVIIKKGHHDCDKEVRANKKVIIIDGDGSEEHVMVYPHGGHKKVMKFKSEDGEEDIIIVSPEGHTRVIKWTGEDGEDIEIDYEFDMENLEKEMEKLNAEMKEMEIIMLDEEGRLNEKIIEIESLAELKELEEFEHLSEMEVIVVPPAPHIPSYTHNDFTWHHKGRTGVSDEELRDAGIKNKPDRLELEDINIDIKDGVVDLSFVMTVMGSPKVAVYNVYGDKVYSGKPELLNNSYQVKMDLSKKQHGTYYLMIMLGNSSKTMRLKI